MAAGTGLAGQWGFKSESAWGTAVVVDKFNEFTDEGLKQEIARIPSQGIRAGRRTQHRRHAGGITCGGPLNMELPNTTMATWLRHMFGTIATTGTGPYTHTASPGPLAGKSFTGQVGRPDIGGTVRAFTYPGCKLAEWEITCAAGDIAKLALTITAKSETTATALAVASYDSALDPFTFDEGSLSIAGTPIATVKNMSLKGTNNLAADRLRIGSVNVREQLENDRMEYSGSIVCDFEDLTAYTRYVNKTQAALVLAFSNGVDSLTFTCNTEFDGETPTVGGMEMLEQPLPFVCLSATSDAAAITAVLVNGESSSA